MSLPSSGLLRWLMGMMISGVLMKIWFTFFYQAQTFEQAASSYIAGFFFTYMFGAVWSALTIVWVPACLLAAVFVWSLLWRGRTAKSLAQLALALLVLLSYFTFWLEAFVLVGVDTSVSSVATIVIAEFLGTSVVDLGATIAYAVILFIAWDAINAERRPGESEEKDDGEEPSGNQQALLEEEVVEAELLEVAVSPSAAPPIAAPPIAAPPIAAPPFAVPAAEAGQA